MTIERATRSPPSSQQDAPSVRFEYTGQAAADHRLRRLRPVDRRRAGAVHRSDPGRGGPADQRRGAGRLGRHAEPALPAGPSRRDPASPERGGDRRRDVVVLTRLGGDVTDPWTCRRPWRSAGPAQHDFVVEIDADDRATVVFGDGALGAVPDRGARDPGDLPGRRRRGRQRAGRHDHGRSSTRRQLALLGATVTNPDAGDRRGASGRASSTRSSTPPPCSARCAGRSPPRTTRRWPWTFNGVGKVRARRHRLEHRDPVRRARGPGRPRSATCSRPSSRPSSRTSGCSPRSSRCPTSTTCRSR